MLLLILTILHVSSDNELHRFFDLFLTAAEGGQGWILSLHGQNGRLLQQGELRGLCTRTMQQVKALWAGMHAAGV